MTPPRVAVVDDHELIAASLAAALGAEGYEVVAPRLGEVGSLAELTSLLVAAEPAVAVVDLDLGAVGTGEELIEPLAAVGTGVIVVSGTEDVTVAGACLERGAAGWLAKRSSPGELFAAVRAVLEGRRAMTPDEVDRYRRVTRDQRAAVAAALAPFARLTAREGSVLAALMDGEGVGQIAASSFVSEATVRSQVRAILAKLGVHSQLEVVAMASRAGWTPTR